MDPKRKLQLIIQTKEVCTNMTVGVRQLRLTVLDLFNTLADNGPDPNMKSQHLDNYPTNNNKLYHQQTLSNLATSHSLCTSSTPPIKLQRQQETQQQLNLLQSVNQMISTMLATIRSLDQDMAILSQNSSLINIGETVHLALDSSPDKHNLYIDLCQSYKTFAKLQDYSAHCHGLLHQQSLKRVHRRVETANVTGPSRDPRADSIVATFNPYIYKVSMSHNSIVTMLDNAIKKCEFMEGSYSQPFGVSTGVLQISVNRILKAILVMRGIVIDAVIVKAYHESFVANKGNNHSKALAHVGGEGSFVDSGDDIDLWSESKYAVFKKLTHHANAAVLHFQYPTYPEIAVRSFLSWFNSYQDLFSATCSRCNSRLRKFMPPICRDFSTGFYPHHDSCK